MVSCILLINFCKRSLYSNLVKFHKISLSDWNQQKNLIEIKVAVVPKIKSLEKKVFL